MLFIGCASGNTESTASTGSAASSQQEPVTIHLFHQKQEAQETFAKIIDTFHTEYPYITVEQEIVTNDPSSVLKARIATDEEPDIFQGALNTMDIAQGGYLMDLAGQPFLQNINDEALKDSSFTDADGHTWAMPIDGSCEGIFYNKDIFAKYDLTVPTTISQFKTLLTEMWCSNAKLFSAVKGVSVNFDPLAADVNAYIDAGMVTTQADRGSPTAFQPEFESALSSYLLGKASLPDILKNLDSAWDTAVAASQS